MINISVFRTIKPIHSASTILCWLVNKWLTEGKQICKDLEQNSQFEKRFLIMPQMNFYFHK